MKEGLELYGVRVVAISKDSVDEAAIHKSRDGLALELLADPNLDVIRRYGVEHHKSLGMETRPFKVLGLPIGFKPSFKAMAIPTTLLIDEHGIIRWVDQSDDYRLRSDQEVVMNAVETSFAMR